MYKMKREELRNNRSHKIGSISNFHIHRNTVEGHLEQRVSQVNLTPQVNNGKLRVLFLMLKIK